MTDNIIFEDDRYRICIEQDMSPESPREWDNLGIMYLFTKGGFGDKHDKTLDEVKKMETSGEYIWLPVCGYSHGGYRFSTTPFSCPWDSGQAGIIAVDKETVRKEYGDLNDEVEAKVKTVLKAEVENYDQYVQGEIYFFVIEEKKTCAECGHTEYEEIDRCGGFYGDDPVANGMLDHWGKDIAKRYRLQKLAEAI